MNQSGEIGKQFNPIKSEFNHEQLAKALYHLEDLTNYAFASFFPRLITADCIKRQIKLEGDAVYVLLPIKEARTRFVYETISAGTGKTYDEVQKDFEYLVDGVPVKIQVYNGDYEFFKYPDRVIYEYGDYLLPNPFSVYWEERLAIK